MATVVVYFLSIIQVIFFFDSNNNKIAEDGSDGRKVVSVRLFTGDEKGEVRIWDLMPAIKILQERHDFYPLRKRYVCNNPQRL